MNVTINLSMTYYGILVLSILTEILTHSYAYYKAKDLEVKHHLMEHMLLMMLGIFSLTYLYSNKSFNIMILWILALLLHLSKERKSMRDTGVSPDLKTKETQ